MFLGGKEYSYMRAYVCVCVCVCVDKITDGKVIILNLLFQSLRIGRACFGNMLERSNNCLSNLYIYIVNIVFITRMLDLIFDVRKCKFIFE